VAVAAVIAVALMPSAGLFGQPRTSLLLAALAAIAGARPVRISSMRAELTATQPFVLCAMAAIGPQAGVLAAIAGVLGTSVSRGKFRANIRLAFNLGAIVLTVALSYLVFALLGGSSGGTVWQQLGPLVGATTAYFFVNTGLVTTAISLEKKQSFLGIWRSSFLWTALSYFTGLTLAVFMIFLLERFGVVSVALGMPPALLIASFYRTHKEKLEEKQQHISDVEALNVELESTVEELKAALESVKQSRAELEIEIQERLQAEEALRQSEEQLRQSQKMEAIGRLAGGIAHDFNNLLTAITGYGDLLLMRLEPTSPLRREATEISKAAQRAADLTGQLLAFSRQQVLQPKVIDLREIVTDVEAMLRRLIGENITLDTQLGEDVAAVKADPGQVHQVLLNLAVNARDAMKGSGYITMGTSLDVVDEARADRTPGLKAGAYVVLSVADTGSGMDETTKDRLFEPFFTTKEPGKGTGLGLSTVYGIVKQSGGYIDVESTLGEGTTFRVFLPHVEGESAEALVTAEAPTEVSHGTERILLVEDDDSVRELAREILEMNGYTIVEACNGMEALSVYEADEGSIDMMITDLVMPQLGGRDLARKLAPENPDLRVLYLSGYTDSVVLQQGMLDPGSWFLQKPFTPVQLAGKVREALDE
jgi:signal transduction histidine kinase